MADLFDHFYAQYKAESSFASNPTPDTYVPMIERLEPTDAKRESWEDETVRQGMYGLARHVGTAGPTDKGGQKLHDFTMKHYVVGHKSTVPTGAPTAHWLYNIFKQVLGGGYASTDAPTLTLAASSDTSIKCTDASLANTKAGSFFAVETEASGAAYQGRWCQTAVENEATPSDELQTHADCGFLDADGTSWTAAAGRDVYTGLTAYHSDDLQANAWTWEYITEQTNEHRHSLGCQPSGFTMTLPLGQRPTVDVNWRSVAVDSSGTGTMSVQTVTTPPVEPFAGGFAKVTDGSTAISLAVPEIVVAYEANLKPVENPNVPYSYGYESWKKLGATATVTFSPQWSEQWQTWYESQTTLYFECSWGSQPGKMIGVRLPACHIDDYAPQKSNDGILANAITLKWLNYTGDTHTDAGGSDETGNCIDNKFGVGFA